MPPAYPFDPLSPLWATLWFAWRAVDGVIG